MLGKGEFPTAELRCIAKHYMRHCGAAYSPRWEILDFTESGAYIRVTLHCNKE